VRRFVFYCRIYHDALSKNIKNVILIMERSDNYVYFLNNRTVEMETSFLCICRFSAVTSLHVAVRYYVLYSGFYGGIGIKIEENWGFLRL
jgi:hypothetical protein